MRSIFEAVATAVGVSAHTRLALFYWETLDARVRSGAGAAA